jgi:hypothetical protein
VSNHKSLLQTGTTAPTRNHRIGVTNDEAENTPRLRVTFGEDCEESVPPLTRRVNTHTATSQDSSIPVPWRWRSCGARITDHIDRSIKPSGNNPDRRGILAAWPFRAPGNRADTLVGQANRATRVDITMPRSAFPGHCTAIGHAGSKQNPTGIHIRSYSSLVTQLSLGAVDGDPFSGWFSKRQGQGSTRAGAQNQAARRTPFSPALSTWKECPIASMTASASG